MKKCSFCQKENPEVIKICQCGYQFEGYKESEEKEVFCVPKPIDWYDLLPRIWYGVGIIIAISGALYAVSIWNNIFKFFGF